MTPGTVSNPSPSPSRDTWVGAAASVVGMALALALARDMVFRLHLLLGDGVSRVANASYVLFSRDPHLAAVGFIWPPLPSLLSIPLLLPMLLLSHAFPPLLRDGFAGNILSIMAFGGTIWGSDRILRRFTVPAPWRAVYLAAFVGNPLLLFYAANGMSESLLLFCLTFLVDAMSNYLKGEHYAPLGLAGIWLALAFLTGYEAVFLGLAAAVGVTWKHLAARHSKEHLEASLFFLLLPAFYTGVLWMVVQALLLGNPFYFATSAYGNAQQIGSGAYYNGQTLLLAAKGSLGASLYFAAAHLLLAPAFGILAAWSFLHPRATNARILSLFPLSVFLMQFLLTFAGLTAGWARFYFYVVPGAFWLAAALSDGRRWPTHAFLNVLLLSSSLATGWVVVNTWIGHGDRAYLRSVLRQTVSTADAEDLSIAAYLNRLPLPNGPILTDSFLDYMVVINARPMTRMAITSDRDFRSLLTAPWGRVSYFLVPSPSGLGRADAVNRAYPDLYAHGTPWAALVHRWPGYRLFRISPKAPAP